MAKTKAKIEGLKKVPGKKRKSASFALWVYEKNWAKSKARKAGVSFSRYINEQIFKDWQ